MTLYINYVKVDWPGQKKSSETFAKIDWAKWGSSRIETETGRESDVWAKWGIFDENAEVRVEWTS